MRLAGYGHPPSEGHPSLRAAVIARHKVSDIPAQHVRQADYGHPLSEGRPSLRADVIARHKVSDIPAQHVRQAGYGHPPSEDHHGRMNTSRAQIQGYEEPHKKANVVCKNPFE